MTVPACWSRRTRRHAAASTPTTAPAATPASSSSSPWPEVTTALAKNGTTIPAAMNGRSRRSRVTLRVPRSEISTVARMTRVTIRTLVSTSGSLGEVRLCPSRYGARPGARAGLGLEARSRPGGGPGGDASSTRGTKLLREHLVRVVQDHRAGHQVVQRLAVGPGQHEDERGQLGDDGKDAVADAADDLAQGHPP